jgi:hypothetical protein
MQWYISGAMPGQKVMLSVVERTILERLYTHGHIGGRHTAIENLSKGFPKDIRGEADDGAKRLIREGWLTPKRTAYGLQVSINPRMVPRLETELGID